MLSALFRHMKDLESEHEGEKQEIAKVSKTFCITVNNSPAAHVSARGTIIWKPAAQERYDAEALEIINSSCERIR